MSGVPRPEDFGLSSRFGQSPWANAGDRKTTLGETGGGGGADGLRGHTHSRRGGEAGAGRVRGSPHLISDSAIRERIGRRRPVDPAEPPVFRDGAPQEYSQGVS